MSMLKKFARLNGILWWRSLQSIEVAAILFYSLFLLLILGQFIGVAITLIIAPDIAAVRETYPWYTSEVNLMFNLVFINLLWLNQIFFTKISRLRLTDNRKLLGLGMPLKRLVTYLNLAGFLHPVNLLFNVIWILYLGLLSDGMFQNITIILFLLVNYGLINSFKWRFKLFTADNMKWVNGFLGMAFIVLVILSTSLNLPDYITEVSSVAEALNSWLRFTPGMIFYSVASTLNSTLIMGILIAIFVILIYFLNRDMSDHTRMALLQPINSNVRAGNSGQVYSFIRRLGHQGGKFFFTIWNHSYSKTQFLLTYILVVPYILIMSAGTEDYQFMVSVFLAFIPIVFLMVMLANPFGFENKELLLTLQAPVERRRVILDRYITAFKITGIAFFTVLVLLPFVFDDIVTMIRVLLGVIGITAVFLHFILKSSLSNYKKIEEVSLMSVSNPAVPASITFSAMFIVLLLGIPAFFEMEGREWLHIGLLAIASFTLIAWFVKKLNTVTESFKKIVIPKLWNEL
jgi:hypothetical protein